MIFLDNSQSNNCSDVMIQGSFSREYVYGPTKVCSVLARSVDVGLSHCVAISDCGSKVYTWGRGSECQLGIGLTKGNAIPQTVETLNGMYEQSSAGFYHTAVLSDEGVVFVWGKGMASVLKRGDQLSGLDPTVMLPTQHLMYVLAWLRSTF